MAPPLAAARPATHFARASARCRESLAGQQRFDRAKPGRECVGRAALAKLRRHLRDDRFPFGRRHAAAAIHVGHDDDAMLELADQDQHGVAARRREQLARQEQALRALPGFGLRALGAEEQLRERRHAHGDEPGHGTAREDRERLHEQCLRRQPIGPADVDRERDQSRQRRAERERAPRQLGIEIGARHDGCDHLHARPGFDVADPALDRLRFLIGDRTHAPPLAAAADASRSSRM